MNHAHETDARNTPSWSLALPIVGVVIAIVATTTMDAAGALQLQRVRSAAIDALVLVPRAPLPFGNGIQVGQAGALHCRAALSINCNWADRHRGALCREYRSLETNWLKAFLNLLIVTISTALVAIVTEEGFFRGWLWGSLRRKRISECHVLVYTSIAFSAWHISAVTLNTD